jgi:hypothetical protein
MSTFFKRPFFVSCCVHLCVFSLFCFSFKPRTINVPVFAVSYLGEGADSFNAGVGFPNAPAFTRRQLFSFFNLKRSRLFSRTGLDDAKNKRYRMLLSTYLKPRLAVAGSGDKRGFVDKGEPARFLLPHKAPVFVFHPILPAGFSLYFKDRQLAHVELSYRLSSGPGLRFLPEVKRKISSGNLEVDLLCQRYITNYLFAQRLAFAPSAWQVVKIDLSDKDDEH